MKMTPSSKVPDEIKGGWGEEEKGILN